MSEARPRPHWVRLGRELRQMREFAGLTQRDVATALQVSQTTVDRTERGGPQGKPPSWPKVAEWAQVSAAARPDLEMLRELTELALDEHALYRNLMSEGLAAVQEEIRTEEATARLIRNFNPWGIPGLLQTAPYARRVLTLADYQGAGGIDAAVSARLLRQEILLDPAHRFEFVLTEAGLRWRPGPVTVQAAQLAHLAVAVASPTVTFSVVPASVQAHALPMCGFIIYEDHTDGQEPWAAIELHHQRVLARKSEDVDIYRAQYELLQRPAVHGDEALEFVREVARSLEGQR